MGIFDNLQGAGNETIETLQTFTVLNNSLYQILLAFLFIVLGWAIARLLTFFLNRYASRWAKSTKTKVDDFSVKVFRGMITFVVLIISFSYATKILALTDDVDVFIQKVVITLLAYKITASLLKILEFIVKSCLVPYADKTDILDKTIIPTLERIVKIIVWSVVLLMVISNLGYNISSLLAGLGIGGLAIALAAQEALSNFFGSISIFADKTFKVGDYIKMGTTEGTVKSVGLRSTRLDTKEGTELIIPNSKVSAEIIENLSRRPKRRVDITISLPYELTGAKLKKSIQLLSDVINNNKETEAHSRVHFNEFGESGLGIALTYWIKSLDYEEGQRVQNGVNLEIKSAFDKAKIPMAYPTQTLYIKK